MSAVSPSEAAIRAVVRRVLELADFPGRAELLAQAETIEYVTGPITFMQLQVDLACPPSKAASPIPNGPWVYDAAGEATGGLLLWLSEDGYIDALEYHWVTDDAPTELPEPDAIRLR